MPKIRKEKASQFTITSNKLIRDDSLSFKARGIFTYLWSQKDGWTYYESEIVKHTTDGITALRSGLDELERAGYLRRSRERKSGRLAGTVWLLSETGKLKNDEKPILENHKYENPIYENQTLRNTNQKKHQLEETLTNKYNEQSSLTVKQLKSEFGSLWERYPKKMGKKQAFNHYKAWRKEKPKEHTFIYISKKLDSYLAYIRQRQIKQQYILYGSTWFNGRFDDDLKANQSTEPTTGGYEELLNGTNTQDIPDVPDDKLKF